MFLFYWDGNSWETIEENVTTNSYDWDTSDLKNGEFYKIRVIVSDGLLLTIDESDKIFMIKNSKQTVPGFSLVIAILVLFAFGKQRIILSKIREESK